MEKVNTLKLFSRSFYNLNITEIYILTLNNSPKIFLYFFTYNKKFVSSLFGDCNIHLRLQTKSVEVNLVHVSIFRIFSAFKNFYLILKFRFTPRFVVKQYHF